MFKYALLLVVALCAVQGFEARTVQLDDRSLDDVINVIKDIFQKIKDNIDSIIDEFPAFIQSVNDKVIEIIENINMPGLFEEIKNEINLIISLGGAGKKCAEAEQVNVAILIDNADKRMDICMAIAQTEVAPANDQLDALKDNASSLREDITARVVTCIEDSQMNPIALYTCLKGHVGPVREKYTDFLQELQQTMANMTELIEQVTNNFATCVQTVRDDTVAGEQEILNSIKECVAGSL